MTRSGLTSTAGKGEQSAAPRRGTVAHPERVSAAAELATNARRSRSIARYCARRGRGIESLFADPVVGLDSRLRAHPADQRVELKRLFRGDQPVGVMGSP